MESCVNVCVHEKGGKIHPLQYNVCKGYFFLDVYFWVCESPQELCGMGIIFMDIIHTMRALLNFVGQAGYATFSSSRPLHLLGFY